MVTAQIALRTSDDSTSTQSARSTQDRTLHVARARRVTYAIGGSLVAHVLELADGEEERLDVAASRVLGHGHCTARSVSAFIFNAFYFTLLINKSSSSIIERIIILSPRTFKFY
jgi:hypothetical protein